MSQLQIMYCAKTDCFAWSASRCNVLTDVPCPCSFYKNKKEFLEQNEYLDDSVFRELFGKKWLLERYAYRERKEKMG